MSGIDTGHLGGVGEQLGAAEDHTVGQVAVVAHRVLLGVDMREHVVACRGETVGAHAAVVGGLVLGLAEAGEAHDDVAGLDAGIVHHVGAAHAGRHRAVHDDSAHQVAHVGSLATGEHYVDTHVAHRLTELLCAVDDGRDNLAGHQLFVAADGGAEQDVVESADTQQVVGVHHDGVHSDAFPHTQVARLAPVHVSEARLGAGAVGMHYVAIVGVTPQQVGYNLAESLGEEALVDILDGIVHILFRSGNSALVVLIHITR